MSSDQGRGMRRIRRTCEISFYDLHTYSANFERRLNAMLNGVDPKTGEKMTEDSVIDNMITFLIAGHETTSGLLSFAFYYMLKNPKAYEKAQEEVDEVVGKGPITVEHLNKLPYLNAVSMVYICELQC